VGIACIPHRELALLCFTIAGCAAALVEPQTWSFVTSVGGLSIQTPQHTEKGWILPVLANVSGIEAVTMKPRLINSALICENTRAVVEGRSIFLTIETGLVRKGAEVRCPPAALGSIAPGRYRVFYRGPGEPAVPLGFAEVAL